MMQQSNVEACEERVTTRARAAQVGDRLRLWVNAIPVVGAPVAVGLAWLHPLLGSVAVATLTLAWLMGIYRTEKLCQLTKGRLQDAEQELSQARAAFTPMRGHAAQDDRPVPRTRPGARAKPTRPRHTPVRH